MPLLVLEKDALNKRMNELKKQAKRLCYLYELVEWGGLPSKEWKELHELELALGLTKKLLTGAVTHLSTKRR